MSLLRKFGRIYLLISLVTAVYFAIKILPGLRSGDLAGDPQKILEDLPAVEKAVDRVAGGSPVFQVGLGILHQQKHELGEAERLYRKALEMDPDHPDAWFRLGTVYKEQEEWAEAADAFEHSLKKKPDSAHAHNELAMAYEELGRHEEAVEHYEEAVRLDANPVLEKNLKQAVQDLQKRASRAVDNDTPALPLPVLASGPSPEKHIDVDAEAPEHSFTRPQRITLKNGRSITGDIVEKDEEGLWLEVGSGMKTYFKRDDVGTIEDAE